MGTLRNMMLIAMAALIASCGNTNIEMMSKKEHVDGHHTTDVARDIIGRYGEKATSFRILEAVPMNSHYNYYMYMHLKALPSGLTYSDLCSLYKDNFGEGSRKSRKEAWDAIMEVDCFLSDSIGYVNDIYVRDVWMVTYEVCVDGGVKDTCVCASVDNHRTKLVMDRNFEDIMLEKSVLQDFYFSKGRDEYNSYDSVPARAWLLNVLREHPEYIKVNKPINR